MNTLRVFLLLISISIITITTNSSSSTSSQLGIVYEIKAEQAFLIHKVTAPASVTLNGVPAEPVDSFIWNGDGVISIDAKAKLEINPVTNTGKIYAQWEDSYGKWIYRQKLFAPPHHATGLRLASSSSDQQLITGDPVTTNVYLHGDTKAGGPVLPTLFTLLATWGPASISLNGAAFDNPFDGPLPLWVGHTMTSVGARNSDGSVRNISGETYSFSDSKTGRVDHDDLEFHLVFHEAPGPDMTANLPAPHAFFYHLIFEKVKIEIKQKTNED